MSSNKRKHNLQQPHRKSGLRLGWIAYRPDMCLFWYSYICVYASWSPCAFVLNVFVVSECYKISPITFILICSKFKFLRYI